MQSVYVRPVPQYAPQYLDLSKKTNPSSLFVQAEDFGKQVVGKRTSGTLMERLQDSKFKRLIQEDSDRAKAKMIEDMYTNRTNSSIQNQSTDQGNVLGGSGKNPYKGDDDSDSDAQSFKSAKSEQKDDYTKKKIKMESDLYPTIDFDYETIFQNDQKEGLVKQEYNTSISATGRKPNPQTSAVGKNMASQTNAVGTSVATQIQVQQKNRGSQSETVKTTSTATGTNTPGVDRKTLDLIYQSPQMFKQFISNLETANVKLQKQLLESEEALLQNEGSYEQNIALLNQQASTTYQRVMRVFGLVPLEKDKDRVYTFDEIEYFLQAMAENEQFNVPQVYRLIKTLKQIRTMQDASTQTENGNRMKPKPKNGKVKQIVKILNERDNERARVFNNRTYRARKPTNYKE